MKLDLGTWPAVEQFFFFRTFERPHFAVTVRMDVTRLMALKASDGLSPFRTVLWAIGSGLHGVDEMRIRFDGDDVTVFDTVRMSPTIGLNNGDFRFTYLYWDKDRAAFDATAATEIARIREGMIHNPNDPAKMDIAYMSCLPWIDYAAMDNALPHAQDCIPRLSWGRIVPKGDGLDMAMTAQVHHAVIHGRQVAAFFEATQDALASL